MNFDYTYIPFSGFLLFEPLIIVSNLIFLVLSLIYFRRLLPGRSAYASAMAWFMLMLGVSGIFGAICHTVHYQLGIPFFQNMFFFMNALSLFAIFFCFWATYIHASLHRPPRRWVFWFAAAWITALLIMSYIQGDFLLIKINAGVVLLYSFIVHLRAYRLAGERGSLLIVWGIGSSFLSIVIHSAHLSLHEWFNYKDFAHVFMILAMILIYKGARLNSRLHALGEEIATP